MPYIDCSVQFLNTQYKHWYLRFMEKELPKRMNSGVVEMGVEIYKRNNLKSNLKQRKMIYTKWRK